MDALTAAAAAGMRARMESLDLLANNLANGTTPGYKADREFWDLYAAEGAETTMPLIDRHWTDHSQGTLKQTGQPTDVALDGPGYFAVNAPQGTLYTRNGNLRVTAQGELETLEGYRLRTVERLPLGLEPEREFEITRQGVVMQGGAAKGTLEVVDFASREAVDKIGGNYFRTTAPDVTPGRAAAEVLQGKVENANFSVAESAIRMVSVMRQFEMLQRAMVLGGEMSRRAIEEVARPV